MKLRISVGDNSVVGYLNIGPIEPADKDCNFKVMPIRELNNVCEDAECSEIIADGVLDYISRSEIDTYLRILVGKLRHGGELIITGNELYSLTRLYQNGRINPTDFNSILFGDMKNPVTIKHGVLEMDELVDELKKLGLSIITKQLNPYKATLTIKAKRI